jgi:tetratricopeptide (TPR) repeat protein
MLLLLLPLLQYGASVTALPPEVLDRKEMEAKKRAQGSSGYTGGPILPPSQTPGCVDDMSASPAAGALAAQKALDRATGDERVRAGLCLGVALGAMERWSEAQNAFLRARDAAPPTDAASRARLGAMAGNAALAGGSAATALPLLVAAQTEAKTAQDTDLLGTIAVDRARAFVALNQPAQADSALAEARTATPGDAQAWLLSATLSRRQNKLAEAQAQIERAAQIAPQDPEIGLEAGVIAVLGGRDAAARKSWQSVLATAPDSDAAKTAQGYLAQLGASSPGVAKP